MDGGLAAANSNPSRRVAKMINEHFENIVTYLKLPHYPCSDRRASMVSFKRHQSKCQRLSGTLKTTESLSCSNGGKLDLRKPYSHRKFLRRNRNENEKLFFCLAFFGLLRSEGAELRSVLEGRAAAAECKPRCGMRGIHFFRWRMTNAGTLIEVRK